MRLQHQIENSNQDSTTSADQSPLQPLAQNIFAEQEAALLAAIPEGIRNWNLRRARDAEAKRNHNQTPVLGGGYDPFLSLGDIKNLISKEMAASGIHPSLTKANIHPLHGTAIVEALVAEVSESLGKNAKQYATTAVAHYQNLYGSLAQGGGGGWGTWGTTLSGEDAATGYFKPQHPRTDFSKGGKKVKYETPAKCVGSPILPTVPKDVAILTWERCNLVPDEGKTYWQNVKALKIPISLCEGWKKAAALISQGYPAIALRGVTMWHPPREQSKLSPEIAQFAQDGQKFYIVFDQDLKEKTKKNVQKQACSLGWVIKKSYNCPVQIVRWNPDQGKGIDDFIVAAGEETAERLELVYREALGVVGATYGDADEILRSKISGAYRLGLRAERATEGMYLPILPPLEPGMLHLVDAGMGSGKTVRIGQDWIKPRPQSILKTRAQLKTPFTLLITPQNSLGRQTAEKWGLAHIHDLGNSRASRHNIWGVAKETNGIAMCADSLHRLPDWILSQPLLLCFDEVNQVLDNLVAAGTTKDRQSPILKTLSHLCRHAIATGSIVAAEDGITRHSSNMLMAIAGVNKSDVRLFKHTRQQAPWDCTMYRGNISQVSGFRSQLLERIRKGNKLLVVTASQLEGKVLEEVIASQGLSKLTDPAPQPDQQLDILGETPATPPPEPQQEPLKIIRVDSETNEGTALEGFFTAPDAWITQEQPDVLIVSPSAKSGLSIEKPYFDEVWAYFPALDPTTHWQLLGRYRQPVPRHIFTPELINLSPLECMGSARKIRQYLVDYGNHLASHLGLSKLLEQSASETPEFDREIEEAMLTYHSYSTALVSAQKSKACNNLQRRLEQAGHNTRNVPLGSDKDIGELWRDTKQRLEREEAQALASARITNEHTELWAHKVLNSNETSKVYRTIAHKVLLRIEFPGTSFDSFEEAYFILRDRNALERGLKNYANMLDLETTQALEEERARVILSQDVKAFHRLPKKFIQAKLLDALGVPALVAKLEAMDGYNSNNEDLEAFRLLCLQQVEKIRVFLGLNVTDEHTPVDILHRILKKHLGIQVTTKSRVGLITRFKVGPRGQQVVTFRLETKQHELYQKLLKAARLRHKTRITTFSNKNQNIETGDTSKAPEREGGGAAYLRLDGDTYVILHREGQLVWLAPEGQEDAPLSECLRWEMEA